MTPKLVDREARKQQIIQAALIVFSQKGIHKSTMDDVAREAGMGKGTIYEYFPGKETIFIEVFNNYNKEFEARLAKKLFLLTDPTEKLLLFIHTAFEVYLKSASTIGILFDFWTESLRLKAEGFDLRAMYKQYRQYVASILEEGVRSGTFRKMNTNRVAAIILASMDGIVLQWVLEEKEFSLSETSAELIQTILNGVIDK